MTNELQRGSVISHVLYWRTTLTGEEDSRVCEEVVETDGGGGRKEGVKKAAIMKKFGRDQSPCACIRQGLPSKTTHALIIINKNTNNEHCSKTTLHMH